MNLGANIWNFGIVLFLIFDPSPEVIQCVDLDLEEIISKNVKIQR